MCVSACRVSKVHIRPNLSVSLLFEIEFLCVALALLELTLAGLELTEIYMPLAPECWN